MYGGVRQLPLPSLVVANPPKHLPQSTQAFTGMRPEKESSTTLRQFGQHHIQRRAPPQYAEVSAMGAFRQGPGAIFPHLHLLKVGHCSLMIPAILLQTVYRKFDIQASLLA